MAEPRYQVSQPVMLGSWEGTPQMPAIVLSVDVMPWGISYVVEVEPEDAWDDGLRELTEDQILGPIATGVVYH